MLSCCSEDPALNPSLSLKGCSAGGALAFSAHTLASGPAVKLVHYLSSSSHIPHVSALKLPVMLLKI